jgi:hypothetical protein
VVLAALAGTLLLVVHLLVAKVEMVGYLLVVEVAVEIPMAVLLVALVAKVVMVWFAFILGNQL